MLDLAIFFFFGGLRVHAGHAGLGVQIEWGSTLLSRLGLIVYDERLIMAKEMVAYPFVFYRFTFFLFAFELLCSKP